MGYHLRAILLGRESAGVPPGIPNVPLRQGLTMIPITEEISDSFPEHEAPSSLEAWFTHLHSPLEALIGQLSHSGSVAYVELEYFGGIGDQTAAVWQHDHRTWGPEKASIGPVNHALALLGVICEPGQDEFKSVGLDQHRHMEDWLE